MGQSSSRGAQDPPPPPPPPRSRARPSSWGPSMSMGRSSPTASDAVPDMVQRARPYSSRPLSQRLNLNPLQMLSTHREHDDARSTAVANSVSGPQRRPSRMTRARSSLSSFPSLLHRRISGRSRDVETVSSSTPSERPAPTPQIERLRHRHTTSTGYERSPYLPRVQAPSPELNLSFEELGGSTSNTSSNSPPPRLSSARRDGRASSMLPSFRPDRGLRNMTNSLRRRRSPVRREEDQAAMLSRLLSVAAAATAASLMGDDHRAVSEARNVAGDGEDGTFDSFLQALQNGRIASALRQSGNSNGNEQNTDTPGGNTQPLNFFRMFRFGSSHGNEQSDADTADRDGRAENNGEEEGDGRMVPIIIVGIRSINPGSGTERDDNIPPFLDALSSFPTPATSPGEEPMEGWTRQPPNTTRFSHRRRASMGGMNNFSSSYDNQRYRSARPRPWSTMSDSPVGPLQPPSTPASAGLSAATSGANTPTLTASPPSPAIPSSASSRRGSFNRRPTAAGLEPTTEEPTVHRRTPRQRRLSESDFTRFGSGSSRRNGVVEPDNNPGEGSRSWIIYVLGGSYPENHPILTTPSLFTDSPTYEDMLLLSTLLGPAKPPVASEEDVAAAPGLHVIRTYDDGRLVAEAEGGPPHIALMAEARCLVCLCEFEADEEARKLIKAPGVDEKAASALQVSNADVDASIATDSAPAAA
ncbi:hypothetical protein PMIN01_07613 [Paraphaeosphaeria minitans]|uniref:Uncharacterized protein n=1 Tax=Paraphaeosphaeria minitans TaxID=565426 RepID=A0A9P6KQ46_9PLEO|nr:hypothetical protein PMIN01_07613 [Paraphaeosphaeria minitans]